MSDHESRRHPNIILIITDHFRPDFIGAHTPNIMRLAADGTRFTNAYCASPLCQPSRVSMATGLSPAQHGVCGNQSPSIAPDLRDTTFMNRLRSAGYRSVLVGKHHFIDRYGLGIDVCDDDEEIKRYGFDEVTQVVDDGENQHNDDAYTQFLKEIGRLEEFRNGFRSGVAAGRHPLPEDETADGFIGTQGIRFAETVNTDVPFYLQLGFIGPHPPYWFPGEPRVGVDDVPDPRGVIRGADLHRLDESLEQRARYAEKIRLIDRYAGKLVAVLKDRCLLENTVIAFTSDHGDNLGDYGIWDKRFFYEESCGVPLVLSGPGIPTGERLNGPRVSKALVSHLDIYPTVLSLAGIAEQRPRARVGLDLVPMVDGVPGSLHREVFSELATCMMIHTGNWKLVFDPEQGGVRYLFNLHADPEELHNLAGTAGYETVTRTLLERMLAHRIRRTQFSHAKEEQRLQSVRTG